MRVVWLSPTQDKKSQFQSVGHGDGKRGDTLVINFSLWPSGVHTIGYQYEKLTT